MEAVLERRGGSGEAYESGVITNDRATGRFAATSGLTEMQQRFVEAYIANGGKATEAATLAGYKDGNLDGWRNRNNPAVQEAIRRAQSQAIMSGAVVAWGVMQSLMTDPVAPAPVRFQAAKWTLEASGHGLAAQALIAKMGGVDEKPLSEMTVAELEEHVARAGRAVEAMKSAKAAIDIAPEETSDTGAPS